MTYAKDATPPFYHDTRADLRVTRTCRTRAIQTERADGMSARMRTMPFTVSERSIDTLRTSRMKSGASADVGPDTILVASAIWLLFIAERLMRHGHGLLGGISLLALASAVWGQRAVGPGVVWGQRAAGFKPEYVAVMIAYGWFCALSLAMLWRARRESPGGVRQNG